MGFRNCGLASGEGAVALPPLTIWALRVALCYLGIGFSLGAVMLGAQETPLAVTVLQLRPLHLELLLIGWTVQLAMAVAYWILPRHQGSGREKRWLAVSALLLLNLGVVSVGVGAVLGVPRPILVAGRAAELTGALCFAAHAWSRVRAYSFRKFAR